MKPTLYLQELNEKIKKERNRYYCNEMIFQIIAPHYILIPNECFYLKKINMHHEGIKAYFQISPYIDGTRILKFLAQSIQQ